MDGEAASPSDQNRSARRHRRLRDRRLCLYCHRRRASRKRHTGLFEFFLPLLLLRAYRCHACRNIHYGLFFSQKISFRPWKIKLALLIVLLIVLGHQILAYLLNWQTPPPDVFYKP